MSLIQDQEILTIRDRLRQGMISFISDNTSYSTNDVDKAIAILDDYLRKQGHTNSKEESLSLVKITVEALNELNESTEFQLIETDQREDICEIIIRGGHLRGYNDMEDDITGEWREW